MTEPGYFHLHLVSDATGETLITVARAAAAQYANVSPVEHLYPMVRSKKQLDSALAEITEREVRVEMQRHDKEALEFDVTQCRFAEFFRALGEPEIGALLICETDFDIAAAGGGDVSLTRDQTIMQGAPSCTFRYRFAPR